MMSHFFPNITSNITQYLRSNINLGYSRKKITHRQGASTPRAAWSQRRPALGAPTRLALYFSGLTPPLDRTPTLQQSKRSKISTLFLTLSLIIQLTVQMPTMVAVAAPSAETSDNSASTFLVALGPDLPDDERVALLQSYDAELIRWIPEVNLAEIRFRTSTAGTDDEATPTSSLRTQTSTAAMMATHMAADIAVEFIEENTVVHGTGQLQEPKTHTAKFSPDDPELHNSTNGYAQQLLDMESAWGQTMGSASVVIAVLDTGVDGSHPELVGQLVQGYDFINETSYVVDDNGHGTHVGGIIAARINNKQGSAGICPRCKLMPVKVLDKNNVGVWSVIVQGIIFAVDNGAKVINLSLGSADQSSSVQRAVEYAQENGALLVAAAGNSRSRELFFPAAYSGVISVSATDSEDREWSLSNQGTYIDVAAPGYLIYSTSIGSERYSYMTGTSMSAPFVSGLAGLILSQSPTSSAAEVSDRIIHNAVDLGKRGWDSTFGFGRVDAYAALMQSGTAYAGSPSDANNLSPAVYLPLIDQ